MSGKKSNVIDRLTDFEVSNAKPDEGKKEKSLNDGGGLYYVVTATQKRWLYQFYILGEKDKMWLGTYPKVTLAKARKLRNEQKLLVDANINPRGDKREKKIATQLATSNTFESVALEWHAKEVESGSWIPSHANRILKRLNADIFPIVGKRPINSLSTPDLLLPLKLVIKRKHYNLAKAYRQYLAAIMRFAVQTGRIKFNPALDLQGAIPTKKTVHRPALPITEVPTLLTRIDSYKGMPVSRLALLFALLTGARSSEFRFAVWTEFDLENCIWIIPSERAEIEGVLNSQRGEKMHRDRVIYLTNQTIAVLNELKAINGKSIFVFNGRKNGTPISENTVNNALSSMGYNTETDVCLHGFRTMIVSNLRESKIFEQDAIERHIGHGGTGDKVAIIYGRKAQYLDERLIMMKWWADYLDELKNNGFITPLMYSAANYSSSISPLLLNMLAQTSPTTT